LAHRQHQGGAFGVGSKRDRRDGNGASYDARRDPKKHKLNANGLLQRAKAVDVK